MPDHIRRGKIGEPKVVPIRDYQWTPVARGRFLDHLAATCNVREACAAAGRHYTGAYALRRREPDFAAQWQEALETGYATLEAAVMERTLAPLQAIEAGEGPALPGEDFDVERAMKLLAQHHARRGTGGRAARIGGPRPQRASEEETNQAILAQLDRIAARHRNRGRTQA